MASDLPDVSSIQLFFEASKRSENDQANKLREKILGVLTNPPAAYLEDPEWGSKWTHLYSEWMKAVECVSDQTAVPDYTRTAIEVKAGRTNHYDMNLSFYLDDFQVAVRKIEFKYGADQLKKLPQFLSLGAGFSMFEYTYPQYYYDHYLEEYVGCDEGLTEQKPVWEEYQKEGKKVSSSHSFFIQLKEREETNKAQKADVVNRSISTYLEKYASSIQLDVLMDKFKTSQEGKIYLLWSGAFHVETMDELCELEWIGVKRGHTIQVRSGEVIFNLLLRWRNHKGILNPAWQISMK